MTKQQLESKVLELEERMQAIISGNIKLMGDIERLKTDFAQLLINSENVVTILKKRDDYLNDKLNEIETHVDDYRGQKEIIEWLCTISPYIMLIRDYINESYKDKVGETIFYTANEDCDDLYQQIFEESNIGDYETLKKYCETNNTITKAINNLNDYKNNTTKN